MQYLLLLHGNNGYVNAPQCYVKHTHTPSCDTYIHDGDLISLTSFTGKILTRYKIKKTRQHETTCRKNVDDNKYVKFYNAKFYIFLTVHLRIILVGNQLEAQFFYNMFI